MTEVATAYITIAPSVRGFSSRLNSQLNGDMTRAGQQQGERFGSSFARAGMGPLRAFGSAALGLFAVDKIAGFAKTSIEAAATFDQTMSQISAATGVTGKALEGMTKTAKSAGTALGYTATDTAEAMLEMGKAGLNASQIGGALHGTLTLAAAGGIQLGDAATVAANAMATFGLKSTSMDRIAAAFAGGANASTASVGSLAQALGQVGPGAANAGLSLNQTVGVLAAFDQAGIKGSDAGTSLKTALQMLAKPTVQAQAAMDKLGLSFYNSAGKMQPITEIGQQLQDKLAGLSQHQRNAALATIFGADATRAATVLMKDGAKGIQRYIDATKNKSAADKMAKANTEGLAGSLARMKAEFQLVAINLGNKLAPALNALADKLPGIVDSAGGLATTFGQEVKPALDDVVGIGRSVLGFFNALPGPVKQFGVEAAIAAAVLPRVTSAVGAMGGAFALTSAKVKQTYAEMTYAETRTQKLSAVTGNLGGVMRQAAGVGGMALLIDGTRRTSSAMSALETTAGAAATGFAVGGPWGAAIGGGIGLITSLKRANDEANSSFSDSSKVFADYRDSLNQVNGAVQKQTLQTVRDNLQKNADSAGTSLDAIAKLYGVPTRDQIQAIAGNVDAFQRVKSRLKEQVGAGVMDKAFANDFLNFVRQQRAAIEEDGRSIRQNTSDVSSWSKALRGLPKQAVTTLKQEGYNPSIRQLRALQGQYKLTPKQIAIVIKQTGIDATVSQIMGKLKPLPKQTAKLGSDTGKGMTNATVAAMQAGGSRMSATFKAKAGAAASGAAGTASSGGRSVGIAMADGFASTVGGGNAPGAFAALVSRTYHAGMAAADAHSPSRKTKKLGQWMGDGLVLGLAARVAVAAVAGDALARAAVDGADRAGGKGGKKAGVKMGTRIVEGWVKVIPKTKSKLSKQYESIVDLIGDGLSGKGKKGKAKVQEVKDSLGKLTDSIKTQLDKQLQAAKDKVSKIADTISSLKDTIAQTASAVAQNYLPDFTTNALFGPDGKMIKGTAVSSFKSQIAAQGSMLSQVTAAYKKLVGEGLNGDWLSSLLQSGNNNLILDLGASSKSDALSAQSMYQNVTAQANALGTAVANNTTSKSQLDTAVKQLAVAQRQELAAQRREKSLNSIDHKLDKLDKLKKLDTLPADITRGLNQSIAAANKGRRS